MKIIALAALAALAALPLAAATVAAELAGLPVDCVSFQDDAALDSDFSTLRMGQCLKPGDAICSSTGSWAFGVDRTEGTVKLWEGDRVSRFECVSVLARIFDAAAYSCGSAIISN
jgi:hypothetical protein